MSGVSQCPAVQRETALMSRQVAHVFCRTGADDWRRVLLHDDAGVIAERERLTFSQVWSGSTGVAGTAAHRMFEGCEGPVSVRLSFNELLVPVPELNGPALAFALTYPEHQKEARQAKVFSFHKRGVPARAWGSIRHREGLDYEAEIALLLHRSEPGRFGYLLANDLTDRLAQVRTHDPRDPGPGFSEAKSFPGALCVGPLLVIDGPELWPELEITLELNGEVRQQLKACDCLLTPEEFCREVFSRSEQEWALVLTGTTGGTLFRSPGRFEGLGLLVLAGFSMVRARESWLGRCHFLGRNDQLRMTSRILGTSHAIVETGAE